MKRYGSLRINIFLVFVLLLAGLVLYRLFVLSVLRHSTYSRTAQAQSENISNILARGNIYLSDKSSDTSLAAANKKFALAYIIPNDINPDKKNSVIDSLAGLFDLDRESLAEKVNSDSKSIKVIARRITDEQVKALEDLNTKGVGISYETDRFYPGNTLAANLLGFLGYDSNGDRAGQYGVEGYYDKELTGQNSGTGLFSIADPSSIIGSVKNLFNKKQEAAKTPEFDRPSDLILTVDKNIQVFVEDKLQALVKKWDAQAGTVIIEDPETGRILAMADWPTFDPNSYATTDPKFFVNHSTQWVYEPGSSFKPITMSAGLDLSKVTPDTTYEDVGFINNSGYTIHNFSDRVFGVQTMTQVLEKSINTGAMYVETKVGDDEFLNYTINMGFGQKTGIDLPGEVSGDISNLYSGRKINFLTASFGQGISVTPLQIINAYSAIANGGRLMKPYLVDKIIKENGQEVVTKPEVVGIPISEKTAVKLQSMLTSVVDKGFDKARISGYDVAGKTGTAQIPDGKGGYLENQYIHNFVGFAPAYNARFVILIKLDKPQGITFASDSLSPAFKDLAAFLLNYYNIPPTRK